MDGFNEAVQTIANYGACFVVLAWSIIKDYKFMTQLTELMGSIRDFLHESNK